LIEEGVRAIAGRTRLAETRTRETVSETEKAILEQWAVQYFRAPLRHAMRDDAIGQCLAALLDASTDELLDPPDSETMVRKQGPSQCACAGQ
jgi:hypothetical protein